MKMGETLNYDMTFMIAITLDKYNRETGCYICEPAF